MYIISKLLYILLNPMTWILTLLIWALLSKTAAKRLKFLRLGIFTFLFFSFAPIFQFFAWTWEIPLTDMRTMEKKYDIGIVLGGYSNDAVKPNDRLHFLSSGTRLTTAIELYKKGIIKKILLTGGSFALDENELSEADKAARFLATLGIPETDIIIERGSLNTHENATFTNEIIVKNHPNSSNLLITSAWHMRRSRACFSKTGLTFDTFSTDPFEGRLLTSFSYYFLPNTTVIEGWRSLIKEWFGFALYKIMGRI